MPRDIHTQPAQLLNEPPDFRPARPHLLGNLGAADDDGRVAHKQANNMPQANIGRLVHQRQAASFCGCRDGGIITSRWPARAGTDSAAAFESYVAVARKLIFTATADCVSAPTEMKSAPASA